MADLSTQPFTTASQTLVNYDNTDVSNGTGYETYYLIESEDSTGKDYHLTPTRDYSNNVSLQVLNSTQNHDYDLTPFTIPKVINGDVLISLPVQGTANATYPIIAELYKWNGTTETQLGSTINYSFVANAGATVRMLYFIMPIVNTLIPSGETLRLRISIARAGATPGYLGIDPANRTNSNLTITTTSKISVPYKLDL